jgi:hypothetical protein
MADMQNGLAVHDDVASMNVLEIAETELNASILLFEVLKSLLRWIVYCVADQANLN